MFRFAVYYVPPARSPFYRLGTSLIGYDVRARQARHPDNPIRARLPDFDERYVRRVHPHGLHCTLVYPQACRPGDLPAIAQEIEHILNSLSPASALTMSAADDFIARWQQGRVLALAYQPDPILLMFHALLVAALARYVQPNHAPTGKRATALTRQRRHHYHYHHIFDDYRPHFTLLNPYEGTQHKAISQRLASIFGEFKQHTLESVCLLSQSETGAKWQIVREFMRAEFPQAL